MSRSEIRLSVIMPVYNAEKFLDESISSILTQTFSDFEFLIFNDASTDNSLQIIQSYNDPRIILINSPENKGYVKHLNAGLKIARGKYIARMDADDISFPSRFEKQIRFLDSHPETGVCGTKIQFIGQLNEIVERPENHSEIFTHLFLLNSALAHPTVMIRGSVLVQHHIQYNESLLPAEDYALWVELSQHTKLYNLQEVLLKYRVHENSESMVKQNLQISNANITRKNLIANISGYAQGKDDLQLEILLNFLRNGYERKSYSKQDIRDIKSFIEKAIKHPYLIKDKIINSFGRNFYLICYNSTAFGLMAFKEFYSLNIYPLSPIEILKFFLRSLFRKPPVTNF